MSLEDPFFVVRGEVQKAVNTARGLYQRWCELLQESAAVGREELDWTTNELRNGLRSIEWDLEDLEETIDILGLYTHRQASCPEVTQRPAGCQRSLGHISLHRGAAGHTAADHG
uniref:Syntaxin 10 n=1 Tax=Gorilla gorilla gorilla TaxID=9595 RepID=A0A2I2Z9I1_GORGO